MALRMDESSYSQLVKKAKELDGISNPHNNVRSPNVSSGVKVGGKKKPSVTKRTTVPPQAEGVTVDTKTIIDAVVGAIRSELRGTNSFSSEDTNTIYIAKDAKEVESHINSDISSEANNISSTLEKLKKLKGENNGK